MDGMTLNQLMEEAFKDPEVKAEYDRLEPEFAIIEATIMKRLEKKMTQKALAQKLHTKQSAISRFESGLYNPSIKFLSKVAKALDYKVDVTFSPLNPV